MGSGEVAIVALSTMISLKVTFSDGLGEGLRLVRKQFGHFLFLFHKRFHFFIVTLPTHLSAKLCVSCTIAVLCTPGNRSAVERCSFSYQI